MSRVETVICEILEEYDCTVTTINESLRLSEDLGIDSIKKVQIICEIEKKLLIEFSLEDLHPNNFKTVGDLFKIVNKYNGS